MTTTSGATARAWVQWKNVDLCADITCECGFQSHLDGIWSGKWKCGGCGKCFNLPWEQTAYETEENTEYHLPTKSIVDAEGEWTGEESVETEIMAEVYGYAPNPSMRPNNHQPELATLREQLALLFYGEPSWGDNPHPWSEVYAYDQADRMISAILRGVQP